MKRIFLAVLFAATQVAAFCASPDLNRVPANAKWLLFVDGAGFRKSRIGSAIINEKLEAHLGAVEKYTGADLNFSFNDIKTLTAFGSRVGPGGEFDAVLLIDVAVDLRADIEKLLARKSENPGLALPIAVKSEDGIDYYTVGGDLVVAPAGKGLWVLSKNKQAAFAAREVAIGKAPALGNAAFLNFPVVTNSFFFLAAAQTGGVSGLPAQARILQKADGVRIAVAEEGEKLRVNMTLRAKDEETLAQLRDVLQGLKALVALGGAANEDLAALTSSAEITSGSETVSVNLSLPLFRAMRKLREDH